MNNYELFNFENINNGINILKPMDEYKKNINYLYKELDNAKPIEDVPDKLYRDEFMEQDIEIDISSNKFREVWNRYKDLYEEKNSIEKNKPLVFEENVIKSEDEISYEDNLDSFYAKVDELDNYLIELKEQRKELNDKRELLELTKKELEQEKELLNIEKEKFEEYKISENDKLNKDKIRFQNMVEEMKKKIETILN